MPNIDAADLGWLAGIIDGEGSIALSHGGTRTPHLRVQVTNGSQSILDKIGRTLAAAGITSASFREIRGTTNVSVGTSGALLLHRLLRSHLVRQVDQFDAAVEFMRRRYDEGRLRVYWSAVERAEWERLRQRFHSGAKITEGRV